MDCDNLWQETFKSVIPKSSTPPTLWVEIPGNPEIDRTLTYVLDLLHRLIGTTPHGIMAGEPETRECGFHGVAGGGAE